MILNDKSKDDIWRKGCKRRGRSGSTAVQEALGRNLLRRYGEISLPKHVSAQTIFGVVIELIWFA